MHHPGRTTRRAFLTTILTIAGTTMFPQTGSAGVVLLQDFYGPSATACSSASCDVIGEKEWFDIDKIRMSVTSSLVQIDVYLNFFNPGLTQYTFPGTDLKLNVGDLLFEVNGQYKYGIALQSHAGSPNGGPSGDTVNAGDLYKIANGNAGIMTAAGALQHASQYIYRYADPVWLWKQGNNMQVDAAGTLSITNLGTVGSGSTLGYYDKATITFTPTAEFLSDYTGSGFELGFSAADCANDVLQGYANGTVPEPGTLAVFALGLAGLGASRHKKKS
jgi:hypothetical protein